jgi:hypothetical protein
MQITFDTNDLSAEDRDLIARAIGVDSEPSIPVASPTAAPAVAKKAAAKKAAAPAPVVEEEPEPEEDEDVLGGSAEYTMGDAVARATELVGDGQAARVKAALADLGVKKVSELKSDEDINAFVVSLED